MKMVVGAVDRARVTLPEGDIADKAGPLDEVQEGRASPEAHWDPHDADTADMCDQKLSVSGQDHDNPPAADRASVTGRGFWPAWEYSPLTPQRSFVEDIASLNEPYRPDW